MSWLSSRDVRRLFTLLIVLSAGSVLAIQAYLLIFKGGFSFVLLMLSLVFSAAILGSAAWYFKRQQALLDEAARLLDLFAAGDESARIECDSEGSMARLFHSANQLAATLSAGKAQAQREKLFLKDTISDISHQLKTPLAALEIYNSLLLEERGSPEAVRQFAAKTEKELTRIEQLIQSLLKITRLDSGSIVMDMQEENISDIIEDICEHFSVRASQEQKRLLLDGSKDAALLCDRVWLTEAVSNIVKNAFDHTKAGDTIELLWAKHPSSLRITVKDSGSGIHPEDIYHIFKRFYRSRFSKDTQGVGLGLPLARSIVEAHGGTIEVDSEPGRGSTFTLRFLQLTEL